MPQGISKAELQSLTDAYLFGENIAGTRRGEDIGNVYADRVQREFRKLEKKIRIEFTERDPYRDHEELAQDVLSNKRMYVYTGFSDVPLWSPEVNWMARAVHDYDHVMINADFSMMGELAAYQVAADKAPQLEPLFLSEIALQAAVSALTGSFPDEQRIVFPEASISKLAARYRRNGDDSDQEALRVWDAGGALKYMSPTEMMALLAIHGVPMDEAMTLVLAADTVQGLEESP